MKWAKCNVGATVPESTGLYFSWGNTDGHPAGGGYDFSQNEYNKTPAEAITENLTLDQDAARAYLGTPWRMPAIADFKELYDNCTSVWTTQNGMNGRLFTSNVNGNTLFFPAAGNYNGLELRSRGSNGDYWSATYYSDTSAPYLNLSSSDVITKYTDERRKGFSVRAVKDGTPYRSIIPPTPGDYQRNKDTQTVEMPREENEQ